MGHKLKPSRSCQRGRDTAMSIRARRSTGPVVAITGAASGAGRGLTARLAGSAEVRKVVALDDHRGDVPGVTWRVVDATDPLLAGRLSHGDVIVPLALERSPDLDPPEPPTHHLPRAPAVLPPAAPPPPPPTI